MDEISGSDIRGNCAVWRLWYIDTRLGNPHLTRNEVVKYAQNKLDSLGSLYKYIKSYQLHIMKYIKKRR